MVGVAGKSKGCNTCRRRKVRCSQERPSCSECVRIGRSCEGYERYPVFINRFADGLQKRKPLEEAKSSEAKPRIKDDIPRPGHSVFPESLSPPLSASPAAPGIWFSRFIAWFLDDYYIPIQSSSRRGPLWLYQACQSSRPLPELQKTLTAVSLVRCGRVNNDEVLIHEGQRAYGQALMMLKRAVETRQHVWHEETLAAVRAMVLYELYEATSNTPLSWQNHVSGLTYLISSRGPRSYGTSLARAVLEESRYLMMIHSIMLRKGSVFADSKWRTTPWIHTTKDAEQVLYDHGFDLASILEQADRVRKDNPPSTDLSTPKALIQVMESCYDLHRALDRFRDLHLPQSELAQLAEDLRSSATKSEWRSFDANALQLECLRMTWCTLKLVLAWASKGVASGAVNMLMAIPAQMRSAVQRLTADLDNFSNKSARVAAGHQILASLESVLQGDVGQLWLNRTIFPLKGVMTEFSESKLEARICQTIKEQIFSRKGFRFVHDFES